ncbi:DNA topoisomerase IV, alpha subunit, partial [Violaceomyces palustris]
RDMFYADVELFGKQIVVDKIVDQLSHTLSLPRSRLGVTAASKGLVAGNLSIAFRRVAGKKSRPTLTTSGRYETLVPSVEGIEQVQSLAKWILVVEKEATFKRLLEEGLAEGGSFCRLGPGIIITVGNYGLRAAANQRVGNRDAEVFSPSVFRAKVTLTLRPGNF